MNRIETLLVTAGVLTLTFMTPAGYGQTFTFSTIAGGSKGTNDGAESAAQFSNPEGVAVDSSGNIYVADEANNAIRQITPSGTNWIVTTIAGGSNAAFSGPTGIAVDNATNLYVADQFNQTIRKLTPGTNWMVTTLAGQQGVSGANDGTNAGARFHNPTGVAVDSAGNLFVADEFNNSIRKITLEGTNWVVNTIAGSDGGYADGTNTAARFFGPSGVAVDESDRVYVADQFNNTIRLITPTGTKWVVTTIAGQVNAGASNGLGTNALFTSPVGVAVDGNDNVYVADLFNDAIRKLAPTNTSWLVSTIGGGAQGTANGTGTNARFYLPYGVTADGYGNVFIADSGNNAIRMGISSFSTPETGSVTVLLAPTNAVDAGAEWQLDGGSFQASGATLTNLSPGLHTITFSNILGYATPAYQRVVVTAHQTILATGNYPTAIPDAGSLQVLISPSAADADGAQWQVDNGPLQTNGAIVAGLSVGTHSLSFTAIPAWTAPQPETVTVTNSQTTLGFAVYVLQTGSLEVTILPAPAVNAGARWQVDGGELQASGATLAGLLPGSHTITFNGVLAWTTPAGIMVSISNNQMLPAAGIYVQASPQLTGPRITNGAVSFVLNGVPGITCVIEASSNLVSWRPISTNTIPLPGSMHLTNSLLSGPARQFYRAAIVPPNLPLLNGLAISNNMTQLVLNGSAGSTCIIQASSDLVTWSPISTNTIPLWGAVPVTDLYSAGHSSRFYRALIPQ